MNANSIQQLFFQTLLSYLKQFTNYFIILHENKLVTTSNPYLTIKHIVQSNKIKKEWLELADQIVFTGRQSEFISYKLNHCKIGFNILDNRFYALKQLAGLNLNMPVFEIKIKIKPNELLSVLRCVLWNLINPADSV